jgi:plastocyanin
MTGWKQDLATYEITVLQSDERNDIMNKRIASKMIAAGVLALLALMMLAACNKKENTEQSSNTVSQQQAAPAPAATPIDPATVATVSGTVKFEGTAPKPSKIDMSQDPACKGTNEAENVVVEGGDLANVFVYVKDGLGSRTFDVPKDAVVLDQSGCKYHPHVLGVMAGQTVQIKNDDQTTHNIHPTPKDNREWNESQPPSSAPLEKNFAREEVMLPVKCNQHPWMKMYVNVVKSPFFAVTDKSGKYEIKGLPPGDYTIAFVHEKLGEQDQKVTVAPKESKTLDQSFKASGE